MRSPVFFVAFKWSGSIRRVFFRCERDDYLDVSLPDRQTLFHRFPKHERTDSGNFHCWDGLCTVLSFRDSLQSQPPLLGLWISAITVRHKVPPRGFPAHGLHENRFDAFLVYGIYRIERVWALDFQSEEDFLGLPLWVSVAALAATTVLCKSTGALLLVFVGLISLLAVKYLRTSLPVIMLACATIMYIIIRGSGLWSGTELVDVASATVGQERADSLGLRIVNETALAERAREHLLLGWGGWGDSRIVDEEGRDTSITDGYWIIVFGTRGALGLTAFLGTVLGPALFLPYRISGKNWMFPAIAPAAIGALILCLWMLDCIPNAMFNPIYLVVAGGLAGFRRVGVPRAQEVRVPTRPLKYAARHPGGATNAEHT